MGSLIQRLTGGNTEPPGSDGLSEQQARLVVKGVVNGTESFSYHTPEDADDTEVSDVAEWVTSGQDGSCYVEVSGEQLAELRDLPCFDDSDWDARRAISFAFRFNDATSTIVRIDSYDDFTINLHSVTVTELSNEVIERFARDFGTSISAEFDPLAEQNDEPTLRITPF